MCMYFLPTTYIIIIIISIADSYPIQLAREGGWILRIQMAREGSWILRMVMHKHFLGAWGFGGFDGAQQSTCAPLLTSSLQIPIQSKWPSICEQEDSSFFYMEYLVVL